MDIKTFRWWLDKGMYRIGHFFSSLGPISLSHCTSKLEMPVSEKFRFLQISHFLHTLWKYKPDPQKFMTYELWCVQTVEQRGGISITYSSLATDSAKLPYMLAWENDLQESWNLGDWYRFFKGICNSSLTV